ncbi:pentatricopeptide repeat protein [Aspergillus homomorphus CBS 101889]|uniref:Pentatricopeptide repeat protein n=1 Tax=Aspergillus homomorphus (strain CBS 101889) TaxID=1450537 RepID=A0A395HJ79_ASPHC|nr:pentatricopeptide repeat protein [Aspergillus homomorphus CBS 101889]RAL07982.1 pentatricopeptide repeat protein [Aspergillus homomorphus CBS 101889]
MIPEPTAHGTTPAVPSRNALRVLRRLALAGSTVGSFCTLAAITYDVHRRVSVAERIVENKRTLQTSAPHYDATSAAKRLARMMAAAEAGEFDGLASMKDNNQPQQSSKAQAPEGKPDGGSALPEMYLNLPDVRLSQAEKLLRATRPGPLNPQQQQSAGLGGFASQSQTEPATASGEATENASEAAPAVTDRFVKYGDSPLGNLVDLPVTEQMERLLEFEYPIEAAQVFLDNHPSSLLTLPEDRRELAKRVFYANCTAGNVLLARNVFERLEDVHQVDFDMWKTVILKLAAKGHIESTAAIYSRFMHDFTASPDMLDIVLRCLVESQRLTTAKWLLLRNIQHDRGCGLCGAYLTGLWRKTRSIELMNSQLRKLLQVLGRLQKRATDKLFNPVIKAYVEFGRLADAEALAKEMIDYGAFPGCRTKGLLVLGKAFQCDWDAVHAGLKEMLKEGLPLTRKADFIPIFDRIFLEFWPTHNGREIKDFIYRSLDEYNMVPDRVLYRHMIEALVMKGDREMVYEFLRYAKDNHWPKHLNEYEFLEMLRARRHALEESPIGFWQMLQAARVKHGQSQASQRILGYDKHSFPSPEVNRMPFTEDSLPFFKRMKQETLPSKRVHQYQKLDRQMSHGMHSGKFLSALRSYEDAKRARFQLKQVHVELAVISTILEKGIEPARALIEEDWGNIRALTRFLPQFFRVVNEIDTQATGEHIKIAVLRWYDICTERPNLTPKHHLLVSVCRRVITQDDPKLALELLSTVYASKYRKIIPFDGVCLKMFLRAFANTDNPLGVRWCLLTALTWREVHEDFLIELRSFMGRLRHHSDSHLEKYHYLLEREEYITHLANLVMQKFQSGEGTTWDVHHNPSYKKNKRELLKRPLNADRIYVIENVERTVPQWDEEYELEAALGRLEGVPTSTVAQLTEEHYLAQELAEEIPTAA